jgi:hypothetical protein
MRSIATRKSEGSLPAGLDEMIAVLRAASFDLIIIETRESDRVMPEYPPTPTCRFTS